MRKYVCAMLVYADYYFVITYDLCDIKCLFTVVGKSFRHFGNSCSLFTHRQEMEPMHISSYSNLYVKIICINIYILHNNNLRVSNIRVSNRTLIYNVWPKSALT